MSPRAPSPLSLLSGTVSFPSTISLSPISSSFLSTLPSLPGTYSPNAPMASWHRLSSDACSALRHQLSPASNTPFPFSTVRSNRTERKASVRSYLAERRAFVRPNEGHDRTNGFCSAIFGRTTGLRLVLFDRTMTDGRGHWGPVPKSRGGALGESMYQRVGRGFWERGRRLKGRGGAGKEKGMVPKRRCIGGRGCGEKKEG